MALRARSADKASSNRVASILREPHPSKDRDEVVVFIDGEDRSDGAWMIAVCLIWDGIVSAFVFVAAMMFVSGEDMAWILAPFLIPFVAVGIFILKATWDAWTSPRPPDYVFIVSPVEPVAEEMNVQVQWDFVGEHNDFSEIVEFGHCIVRGGGREMNKKSRKNLLSPIDYRTLNEGDSKLRSGEHQQILPGMEEKSSFGGRLKHTFEGSTELLIRWRLRSGEQREQRYNLASVSSD